MPAAPRAAPLISQPFVRSVLPALTVLFDLSPLIVLAIMLKIL
jgi:hypothetical protein